MKNYTLSINFDNGQLKVEEKATEGLTLIEARIIVSYLEEYKNKMLTYISFSQDPNIKNMGKKQ